MKCIIASIVPARDSRIFSDIMPGIVRHDNPTKEHSKDPT